MGHANFHRSGRYPLNNHGSHHPINLWPLVHVLRLGLLHPVPAAFDGGSFQAPLQHLRIFSGLHHSPRCPTQRGRTHARTGAFDPLPRLERREADIPVQDLGHDPISRHSGWCILAFKVAVQHGSSLAGVRLLQLRGEHPGGHPAGGDAVGGWRADVRPQLGGDGPPLRDLRGGPRREGRDERTREPGAGDGRRRRRSHGDGEAHPEAARLPRDRRQREGRRCRRRRRRRRRRSRPWRWLWRCHSPARHQDPGLNRSLDAGSAVTVIIADLIHPLDVTL